MRLLRGGAGHSTIWVTVWCLYVMLLRVHDDRKSNKVNVNERDFRERKISKGGETRELSVIRVTGNAK